MRWGICIFICYIIANTQAQDNLLLSEVKKTYALYQKYNSNKNYRKALPYAKKTYELSRNMFGDWNQDTLISLNNLAELYFLLGKYKKAEPLFLKCLQLRKQKLGDTHPDTLQSINNLAVLYHKQGRYQKAEPLILKCLQLMEQKLGESHPSTLTSLNNLAGLYLLQGKYEKVEPLYLKCLKLRKQKLGESHPSTLTSLNNLAELYRSQGKDEKAEPLYLKCLQLRKKTLGEAHADTFQSINNLAELYRSQGRYEKTETLYLKYLQSMKQTLGETHPNTLQSMNNLAALYRSKKKYKEAENLYLKCLQLNKQKLGESHPSTLTSLNNLAALYKNQQKYEKAEPLYLKCLPLMKKALGETHPYTLHVINNIASLYHSQGKHEKAENLYLKCLQLTKQILGETHYLTVASLNNLGLFYKNQRQYPKAQKIFDEWFNKRNEYLHNILLSADKKTQKSYLQQDVYAIKVLISLYLQGNSSEVGEKIFNYSLQRKNILLYFSPSTISRANRSDTKVAKLLDEQQSMRSTLSSLFINPPTNISAQQLKENIKILTTEIENKEKKLTRLSKNFRRAIRKTTVSSLQKKLKTKEAVVDFLVVQTQNLNSETFEDLPEQLLATITTKNNIAFVRLGKYSSIQELIRQYRKQITNPYSWKINQIARKVYQRVWKPLEKFCVNCKVIYVIPDDDLHLFPFQAMVTQDERYLVETHRIQMISSARYLTYTTEDYDSVNNRPMIFANPYYGKSDSPQQNMGTHLRNIRFSPLPGTAKEGKSLTKMLNAKHEQVATFFASDASKQNITKIVAPKFLHIATHGFFLKVPIAKSKESRGISGYNDAISFTPSFKNTAFKSPSFSPQPQQLPQVENPLLYSGLAFSDANIDHANGILTAMEVLSLDLSGTELVTLSACDTSVGEVIPGDGVYSLRRAFQEAGTKSVLSSLWSASDKGTLQLMQKFYRHYLNKVTPQSAIRAAQLECISEGKYAHPYYWANFVMTGSDHLFPGYHLLKSNSTSATPSSSSNLYFWISTILIALIVIVNTAWSIILKKRKNMRKALRKKRQRKLQKS